MQSDMHQVAVNEAFHFARMIPGYAEWPENSKRFVMSHQITIAGTSTGAYVREAQNAESKIGFTHRSKIAAKETDESEHWLLLCKGRNGYPEPSGLIIKPEFIQKILSKIRATSKRTLKK